MIILYLYDNIMQFKEKEEIKEYPFPKEAMDYGKIKNIPIFETYLQKLVKKEKWNHILKPKKYFIIIPNFYTECDKEVLTVILNNIGIRNIKFIKENKLLKLKKNKVIINTHNKYLTLTQLEKNNLKSYFVPYYIFGNIEKTLDFIINNSSKKSRFYFIGNNNKFLTLMDSTTLNLFYFYDYKTYLINQFIP